MKKGAFWNGPDAGCCRDCEGHRWGVTTGWVHLAAGAELRGAAAWFRLESQALVDARLTLWTLANLLQVTVPKTPAGLDCSLRSDDSPGGGIPVVIFFWTLALAVSLTVRRARVALHAVGREFTAIERHPQGVFRAQYATTSAPGTLSLRRVLSAPEHLMPPVQLFGDAGWHGGELFDDMKKLPSLVQA